MGPQPEAGNTLAFWFRTHKVRASSGDYGPFLEGDGRRKQWGREARCPGWAGGGGLWLAATWQHLEGWQDPGGGHRMCRGAPSLARTFQAPPWQGGREITGPPRKAVKWDNGGTLVTWEVRGLPIQIPHKLPLLVLPWHGDLRASRDQMFGQLGRLEVWRQICFNLNKQIFLAQLRFILALLPFPKLGTS